MSVLSQLVTELNAGRIRVVDLTQPLGPDTAVIGLPPIFAPSPGVTIDVISRYDEKGPAWYWNTIRMGEHTGTHFDAPVHWVSGKDLPENACDTIPARRFVGPACVIDVTKEVDTNPDFLVMPQHILDWEASHGRIPAGAWVLLRTGWSRRIDAAAFLNVSSDGPHSPGFHKSASELLAHDRDVLGVERREHEVDALRRQQRDEFILVVGPVRAHRHAAVAQMADELLGILQPVFHQEQSDHGVLLRHPELLLYASRACMAGLRRYQKGRRAPSYSGRFEGSPATSRTSRGTR